MDPFAEIRKLYPAAGTTLYLDTPTSGLISTRSYERIRARLDRRFQDGMDIPGVFSSWDEADRMRTLAAAAVHAVPDGIFFDANCSSILNVLSAGLEVRPGANIVTTGLAFPATVYTWLNQAKRDLSLRLAPAEAGAVPVDRLLACVDQDTAVISLCAVENTTGFRHDLAAIGAFCRQRGITLAVDATQCIGAMEIDVEGMGIDFLAVSTYKWLNNLFGIGFGFVQPGLLDRIRQPYAGWGGNADRHDHSRYHFDPAPAAARFETGGLNWTGLAGLAAALETYLDLGKPEVERYILSLTDAVYERAARHPEVGLEYAFPAARRSGIVCLTVPEAWRLDDATLRRNQVRAHMRSSGRMRIGLHFYNNLDDVAGLFEFFGRCRSNDIER
jgi:selenocysteine lyase/cysteine desulfurase